MLRIGGSLRRAPLRGLRASVVLLSPARAFSSPPGGGAAAAAGGATFELSRDFLAAYAARRPPFGFNGLGEVVYQRTYSRVKEDDSFETWPETVARVVNGTYRMQQRWVQSQGLGWDEARAQRSAQEFFERVFTMKFLPPGRGLWAMGSPITEEKSLFAALNNCAFVSTRDIAAAGGDPARPFTFLMDASMLGVGTGFDTRGADSLPVRAPDVHATETIVVGDSRESWVAATGALINSYLVDGRGRVDFDYSQIRPAGVPIRGFGGVSSGPETLKELHAHLRGVLDSHVGRPLSVSGIVDMMNLIGKCVVSGNVRQTAEIAFGEHDSDEFMDLKDYGKNPHRASYGWTSNNSIFAQLGMDYAPVVERIRANGEPGFAWLDNMREFGRMDDARDFRDVRAGGGNPCLEQTLESYEMCCLVETFPAVHEDVEDYLRTLKFAFLYAKTVTLGQTHWAETNRVMLRNRRIGCSMSGVAQFVAARGLGELKQWCEDGYEAIQEYDWQFSEWLAVPQSIKTTTIKPSGTVSLLAGATPGMHFPESRFHVRRVRLSAMSDLLEPLREAGYPIEQDANDASGRTVVVEFPVDVGSGVRTADEVSMWEQLSLASFLQRYWSDNQVSCTVTFDPEREGGQLANALDYFQYQLKGVSFLPRLPAGAYPQMPYEQIDEEEYRARISKLRPLALTTGKLRDAATEVAVADRFCDAETCIVVEPKDA